MSAFMEIAIQVGTNVAKYQAQRTNDILLGSIVVMQQQQLALLGALRQGVERLLKADILAGLQHMEYASIAGRDSALVKADISKAMDLFVRAINQATYSPEQGAIRTNIALCAYLLGDDLVARSEIQQAVALLDSAEKEARYWVDFWTTGVRNAQSLIDETPWWGFLHVPKTQRSGDDFSIRAAATDSMLKHINDLQAAAHRVKDDMNA
jgi:hypothetical protein